MKKISALFIYALLSHSTIVFAGETDVVKVEVKKNNHSYDFSVTLFHKDTGWKHYANKWDVTGEDGVIFATRILYHPHVNEQPFTRRLSGVEIPDNVKQVIIRGHDLVHKYGGKLITVELPR